MKSPYRKKARRKNTTQNSHNGHRTFVEKEGQKPPTPKVEQRRGGSGDITIRDLIAERRPY